MPAELFQQGYNSSLSVSQNRNFLNQILIYFRLKHDIGHTHFAQKPGLDFIHVVPGFA